ncbi:MAG: hypothetical protein M9890_12670 [Thermomicrobiales bacterium]|nr:hypothetical protein [Thermomicrobiales bacterium]
MTVEHHSEHEDVDDRLAEAIATSVEASLSYELDDAARQVLRDTARRHQQMAAKLRETPLTNADEPDFVFVPFRAEG